MLDSIRPPISPDIANELDALRRRVAELEAAESNRLQAATSLQQSEENLRTFFNTIDQLLFVLDEQGRILLANAAVYQRLGYSEADLIGQSVLMVHPPERRDEAGQIVADMLAGRATCCPVPLQAKDGRLIPVETRVVKGQWSGQAVIFGVTKDLSDLKASEEKFAKIFEASPTLMAISEVGAGCYIEVNAAFLKALGYSREEVIGRTPQELGLFVDPEQRAAALQQMQRHTHLRGFDVDVRARSGEIHHGLFAAEYVQLQDRRVLLTVMNDVTERKRMEADLRKSELKFRRVVEESADAIVLIDEQGRVIEWNRAAEALTGLSAADTLGQPYWDVQGRVFPNPPTPPAFIARVKASIQAALLSGQGDFLNGPVEHVLRRITGEQRSVLQYIYPIKTEAGYWLGSISRDVTERQQMEEALRASEEKFRRVVEESRDALSLCDEAGAIIEWNRSTEVLTGIPRNEALGQPLWEIQWRLIRPERRSAALYEQMQEAYLSALRTGHASFIDHPVVVEFQHTDGECHTILQNCFPIKTARGYWLGNTSLDITDLKRTEAALNRLNAELEQRVADRTRELIEANLRLTELDRLKDEFISRINHELRTPLTSIKSYTELLTYGKTEKREKYLQIMTEQTERLQQIIENLLEVPQLQIGEIDVNPEYVDLSLLVDGVATSRQNVARLRGIHLQTHLADRVPLVLTDRTLVLRALLNVVTNALNYTPPGGIVTLSTTRHVDANRIWVAIAVADTGPGISDQDRPYIFEPFYRGDATKDYKTPGIGVGLFVAQRLMNTLGGKITVESLPGHGAIFTLWLPDGEVDHGSTLT